MRRGECRGHARSSEHRDGAGSPAQAGAGPGREQRRPHRAIVEAGRKNFRKDGRHRAEAKTPAALCSLPSSLFIFPRAPTCFVNYLPLLLNHHLPWSVSCKVEADGPLLPPNPWHKTTRPGDVPCTLEQGRMQLGSPRAHGEQCQRRGCDRGRRKRGQR